MSEKRTKHRISGEKQKKLRVAAYCRVSTLMDAQDTGATSSETTNGCWPGSTPMAAYRPLARQSGRSSCG